MTIALGMAAAHDRALLLARGSVRRIEIHSAGEAVCVLRSGEEIPLEADGAGVTRLWVALRLRSARRRSLLVAAGMLPPEAFRLLRLWALWRRLPAVAPGQRPA